jgi:hypothetical protein
MSKSNNDQYYLKYKYVFYHTQKNAFVPLQYQPSLFSKAEAQQAKERLVSLYDVEAQIVAVD